MDLQTRKIEFVQKFLKIQNEELLSQLENLLKKKSSSKSLSISPMSIDELNARIDQSEEDFKKGKFKSSTELLEKYK
jgi:DNA-directed RNA polymerase subunit F